MEVPGGHRWVLSAAAKAPAEGGQVPCCPACTCCAGHGSCRCLHLGAEYESRPEGAVQASSGVSVCAWVKGAGSQWRPRPAEPRVRSPGRVGAVRAVAVGPVCVGEEGRVPGGPRASAGVGVLVPGQGQAVAEELPAHVALEELVVRPAALGAAGALAVEACGLQDDEAGVRPQMLGVGGA